MLQQDARNNSTTDIADRLDVSPTTVSNRIRVLESDGVVTGYHPTIDYETIEIHHHLQVTATASVDERDEITEAAPDVHRVVSVRELLTHHHNLR